MAVLDLVPALSQPSWVTLGRALRPPVPAYTVRVITASRHAKCAVRFDYCWKALQTPQHKLFSIQNAIITRWLQCEGPLKRDREAQQWQDGEERSPGPPAPQPGIPMNPASGETWAPRAAGERNHQTIPKRRAILSLPNRDCPSPPPIPAKGFPASTAGEKKKNLKRS